MAKGGFEQKRKRLEQKLLNRLANASRNASLSGRLLAFFIDYILGSIFISWIPMIISSIITGEKSLTISAFISMPMKWQLASGVIAMGMAVYYYCLYPMKESHLGQTPGKQLMKIRVEPVSGGRLTYRRLLLRELAGSFLLEGETAFPSAFGRYFIYLILPVKAAGVLSVLAVFASLGSVVFAVFNERHQMFHDYIGKTVVVKADRGF